MTTDHYENAIAHIQAVKASRDALRTLYREPVVDNRIAARLNHDLGDALKLAEVEAMLHIGDQLADLVEEIREAHIGIGSIANVLHDSFLPTSKAAV